MQPYIKAKAIIGSLKLSNNAKEALNNIVEKVEKNVVSEELKSYLANAPKSYLSDNLDEMLLGESVLNEILKSAPSSFLSNEQQVDMMRLSRFLNKASAAAKLAKDDQPALSLYEKQQMADILERAEKDLFLKEALHAFTASEDHEEIETFLNLAPSFLQSIVKKFVTPKVKKNQDKIPAGITPQSIAFLQTYLSKTRTITKSATEVSKLHAKMEDLLARYHANPASIKLEERLTLTELGKITRSARLNESDDEEKPSFLGQLRNLGLMEMSPKLQKLSDLSIHSQDLLADLDKIIRPVINSHYKDGDVLAYAAKKKSEWLNSPLPLEERLTSFAANGFTHGAKLFCNEGEVQISHVYGNFEQEILCLYQLCISDIWEINITPLVPDSLINTLKEVYGEDWAQKVNELYRRVENEMQTNAPYRFQNVGNNQERRIAAGIAGQPQLFKLMGKDVLGHERTHERDFNKLYNKFYGDELPTDDQICSEWASKATLAAMLETNKRLTAEVKNSLGNQFDGKQVIKNLEQKGLELPKEVSDYLNGVRHWKENRDVTRKAENQLVKILEQQGYSSEDIQLIIRLGNEEIFELPYSRNERLKAIHPGRMVSLLVDKKCAKQKQPPQVLASLVAVH
ncbi:MAG: hypothetical protein LW832_08680 [Parachlamydia sp.]|nr:hypothetical protein [Parachlamydia sp.]